MQANPATTFELPGPYIVEQKTEDPALTIALSEVNTLYSNLYSLSIIYRFNGYWRKSSDLHHWIHNI